MLLGPVVDLEAVEVPRSAATGQSYRYQRTVQSAPGAPVRILASENTRYWIGVGGLQIDVGNDYGRLQDAVVFTKPGETT